MDTGELMYFLCFLDDKLMRKEVKEAERGDDADDTRQPAFLYKMGDDVHDACCTVLYCTVV